MQKQNLFPFFGASLFHFFQPYQRTNTKSIPTIFDNDLSGVLSAVPSTVALTFAGFDNNKVSGAKNEIDAVKTEVKTTE